MVQPAQTATVSEIMSKPVATVSPSDSFFHAVSVMLEHKCGCIVVVQGGVVGIITERDVMRQIVKGVDFMHVPVKDVMSKPVITISPHEDPLKALSIMADKRIRRLPVVHEGKVVGIVTERDLVRWILAHPEIIMTLLSESAFPVLSKEALAPFFGEIPRGLH